MPIKTAIEEGFDPVLNNPFLKPGGMSIEDCFAAMVAYAAQSAYLRGSPSTEGFSREEGHFVKQPDIYIANLFGWNPLSTHGKVNYPHAHCFMKDVLYVWNVRAALRLDHIARYLPKTAATFAPYIVAAESQIIYAGIRNPHWLDSGELQNELEERRAEARLFINEYCIPGKEKPFPEDREENRHKIESPVKLRPIDRYVFALLYYTNALTEEQLTEIAREKTGGNIADAVVFRRNMKGAVAKGVEVLDKQAPHLFRNVKDEPDDEEVYRGECPYCGFLTPLIKGMAILSGMNTGLCHCHGCKSYLRVRFYQGDVQNTKGDTPRLFKEGKEPADPEETAI